MNTAGKYKIFIQCNEKQRLGAMVAIHALRKYASDPLAFEVEVIWVEQQRALASRGGQKYLRSGRWVTWDPQDLQSFTLTRFLPPQLMGFQGRALVIDPDVFARADILELLRRPMNGHAILARRIRPTDGRESYWASSVMLLDCTKLTHWKWEEMVDGIFKGTRDYYPIMSLLDEPEGTIGELEEIWNSFDKLEPGTKLLHTTGRETQPWKTGLPIDYAHAAMIPLKGWRWWAAKLRGKPTTRQKALPKVYRKHPDPNVDRFFFELLQECVASGEVPPKLIEEQVKLGHVRPDLFQVLPQAAGPLNL
jgi:hypothetical protein